MQGECLVVQLEYRFRGMAWPPSTVLGARSRIRFSCLSIWSGLGFGRRPGAGTPVKRFPLGYGEPVERRVAPGLGLPKRKGGPDKNAGVEAER